MVAQWMSRGDTILAASPGRGRKANEEGIFGWTRTGDKAEFASVTAPCSFTIIVARKLPPLDTNRCAYHFRQENADIDVDPAAPDGTQTESANGSRLGELLSFFSRLPNRILKKLSVVDIVETDLALVGAYLLEELSHLLLNELVVEGLEDRGGAENSVLIRYLARLPNALF